MQVMHFAGHSKKFIYYKLILKTNSKTHNIRVYKYFYINKLRLQNEINILG
jgi:hypothetical protein